MSLKEEIEEFLDLRSVFYDFIETVLIFEGKSPFREALIDFINFSGMGVRREFKGIVPFEEKRILSESMDLKIAVTSIRDNPNYSKCPRCRRYHDNLLNYDLLCDRCQRVVASSGEYLDEIEKAIGNQLIYYVGKGSKKPNTTTRAINKDNRQENKGF